MFDDKRVKMHFFGGSYRESDAHFLLEFESLPSADILKIDKGRLDYFKKIAKQIVAYNAIERERVSSSRLAYTLKDRYHLATKLVKQVRNGSLYCNPINEPVKFNSNIEISLLAMLVCDDECKYYQKSEECRTNGMSYNQTLDELDLYYGIRSPKLIQMARQYQILNLRLQRNETASIFANLDTPSRK